MILKNQRMVLQQKQGCPAQIFETALCVVLIKSLMIELTRAQILWSCLPD